MSQLTGNPSTLSAFFDNEHDARKAVDRLVEAGIALNSVQLVAGNAGDAPASVASDHHGGFLEALANFFLPDEDRYAYAEGLRRGGYLVFVNNLQASHYDTALDILDHEGSVDLDEREATWRSEGWTGYQAGQTAINNSGYSAVGSETIRQDAVGSARGDDEVIPIVDERLVVGKRDVNLGRVRVRSYVREEGVSADVNLHEERVSIERRPVDRPLGDADAAFVNRTIEAEEHVERAVVGKETRVTEEISLRKESSERQETINDTVRKTEVEIEDERTTLDRLKLDRE